MTDARSLLAALREDRLPSAEDLAWFAQGLSDGSISDAQAGAFAMGVCKSGLGDAGRVALTLAMRDSGERLVWDLPGPVLDKHSTGGVGDCVSLVLAPALAACGAFVPMISGRGLGHSGGTLDKLDAIPGVKTEQDADRFRDIVAEAGCAIVAASSNIAPADRRLYAVRDVTSTVESLDLITASILSKKLAAGLEGLILDVKVGSGAFMKTSEEANALATALVETANAAGCPTAALITDMSQPLANALGNALEVDVSMSVLAGGVRGPLFDLSCALGGALLAQGGLADDAEAGSLSLAGAIESGRAAEVMGRMIVAQGGPLGFVENWRRYLPEASVIREVKAESSGVVSEIDGEALGISVVHMGGGRLVESDRIDPAVGLSEVVRIGTQVNKGQPLARVHAARESQADAAIKAVRAAITIGETAAAPPSFMAGSVNMARAFLVVMDSVGIGGAPDADRFFNAETPDTGANTLAHIVAQTGLYLPHLDELGLGAALTLASGVCLKGWQSDPKGRFAAATEISNGKDTPSGHWELAGLPVPWDWHSFPVQTPAFPPDISALTAKLAGTDGILGNCHASGTVVLDELGDAHVETGWPICYTSVDSVFQIAAHEEHFGLERLLTLCADLAPTLHKMRVGRVIARPFVGENGRYTRTKNRRDFAVTPPSPVLTNWVQDAGQTVHAIGKIDDIFSGQGIDTKSKGTDAELVDNLLSTADILPDGGLCFANFVEFDSLYGHRRDTAGYARHLAWFDAQMGALLAKLRPDDLLIVTADHGNDPTWVGTDHTRERVPVLIAGAGQGKAGKTGHVAFADVAASIAAHLGVPSQGPGRSFL